MKHPFNALVFIGRLEGHLDYKKNLHQQSPRWHQDWLWLLVGMLV